MNSFYWQRCRSRQFRLEMNLSDQIGSIDLVFIQRDHARLSPAMRANTTKWRGIFSIIPQAVTMRIENIDRNKIPLQAKAEANATD
jgi:hypothetical protein